MAEANGKLYSEPFLNVGDTMGRRELGLMGLAFDRKYKQNGLFYISYSDTDGDRYHRSLSCG